MIAIGISVIGCVTVGLLNHGCRRKEDIGSGMGSGMGAGMGGQSPFFSPQSSRRSSRPTLSDLDGECTSPTGRSPTWTCETAGRSPTWTPSLLLAHHLAETGLSSFAAIPLTLLRVQSLDVTPHFELGRGSVLQ